MRRSKCKKNHVALIHLLEAFYLSVASSGCLSFKPTLLLASSILIKSVKLVLDPCGCFCLFVLEEVCSFCLNLY